MRTTLDIDDRLMEALIARLPGLTKTKAVEIAIGEYVRRGAVDWLLENAGKLELEDVSAEMRAKDRRVAAARAGHVLWSFDSDFERIQPVVDGLALYG